MLNQMKRFINFILVGAIIGVLLFEVVLLTRAQEGESADAPATETATDSGAPAADTTPAADAPAADTSAAETPTEPEFNLDVSSKCVESIKKFMAVKQVEFGDFINTHFRSAKPTSELIPTAIERYRQYRTEIRGEIARIISAEKKDKKDPQVVVNETAACEAAVKEDFDVMKQMIREHIMGNAYAKKTTRLADKLKSINEKLGVLNSTIGQMYGYFGGFSQKLSCYAKQCIKR